MADTSLRNNGFYGLILLNRGWVNTRFPKGIIKLSFTPSRWKTKVRILACVAIRWDVLELNSQRHVGITTSLNTRGGIKTGDNEL